MASDPILGTIFAFAGNFAPRGYALCNGQMLSIQQNAALFAILGTTYGGNGQTTFGLPNLQDRAPIGFSNTQPLGTSGGSATVTLTAANVPSHTHTLNAAPSPATGSTDDPTGASLANATDSTSGSALPSFSSAAPGTAMNAASIGPNAGGGAPVSVQNPFQTVTYIIATEGIFPSRN